MIRRLAIAAAFLLATTQVAASPQTHEFMTCFGSLKSLACTDSAGEDIDALSDTNLRALYAEGWRVIDFAKLPSGQTQFLLERPIAG